MSTLFFSHDSMRYQDHPKFSGVRLAKCVSSEETDSVSVSLLDISAGIEIPVHTHDTQVDSIWVVAGTGKAYVNGNWRDIRVGDYIFVPAGVEHGIQNTGGDVLRLFVHHSPPLF